MPRAAHFKLIILNLINYSHLTRLDSKHTRRIVQDSTLSAGYSHRQTSQQISLMENNILRLVMTEAIKHSTLLLILPTNCRHSSILDQHNHIFLILINKSNFTEVLHVISQNKNTGVSRKYMIKSQMPGWRNGSAVKTTDCLFQMPGNCGDVLAQQQKGLLMFFWTSYSWSLEPCPGTEIKSYPQTV